MTSSHQAGDGCLTNDLTLGQQIKTWYYGVCYQVFLVVF